jgi:uncharacterized cupredoxin-like copper-binding protein
MHRNWARRMGLVFGMSLVAACSGPLGPAPATAVSVEVKEFAFTPAALEVQVGQPVALTLANNGTLEHDFSILEFPTSGPSSSEGGMDHDMGEMAETPDLHVAAAVGQSATLEFTPSKAGTYEFFCTVAGHKEAGMVGTLVVTAP